MKQWCVTKFQKDDFPYVWSFLSAAYQTGFKESTYAVTPYICLRFAQMVKARPASGYNPIIKNLNFNQVKIQINTLPMWHCAKMCNWCKLMQMIIQTNNFNTKHVHVLPDLSQFREGGVMTCQSPRDTLTGMWGNLVYHIWESQWSAHK